MYQVFQRSANSFEQMARARKIHISWSNTEKEARELCASFNDSRNARQIRKGTKWEYRRDN